LLARQPGRNPLFRKGPAQDIASRYLGLAEGTTLNPLKAEMRGGWTGADKSTFGPFAGGELAGAWIEGQNRLPPWIDQLRQGVDPEVAAKRVADAQVDYSARAFTDTERAIKHVVPFYSFGSRMAKFVANEIAEKPGGALAQVIKQQARATGTDENLPPYIRGSMSIPLGESATGDKRFLTGLGLMHEGSFLNIPTAMGGVPSLSETGAQLLASTTPLIKGPLEAVSGQSLFQRTPLGGRPLESMDPLGGGLVENVGQLLGGERQYPAEPLVGPGFEQFLANTPASRVLSTARTLADTRKLGPAMAAELLTGLKISDVSKQQQERILRERLAAAMKQAGAPQFSQIRFTHRQIESATKKEAEQMRMFNALANKIEREQAKARAARKGEGTTIRRRPVSVVQ